MIAGRPGFVTQSNQSENAFKELLELFFWELRLAEPPSSFFPPETPETPMRRPCAIEQL